MKSAPGQLTTGGLRNTHENLSAFINYFLSEYAKKLVWDANGNIRPIDAASQPLESKTSAAEPENQMPVILSDPPLVLLCKHCLMALQEAEIIAEGSSNVAARYQEKGVLRGVLFGEAKEIMSLMSKEMRILSAANEGEKAEIEKSLNETYKTRKKQGTDAALAAKNLYGHLQAIMQIASDAKLPEETLSQLKSMSQSLKSASPQEFFSSHFSNLNNALTPIMMSFFEVNRPASPVESGFAGQSQNEVNLKILSEKPKFNNYSDTGEPNSYVLIKEKNTAWKLVYLNNDLSPFDVDINDVPNIRPILEKISNPNEITNTEMQTIKKNLALRWNPSTQEREEWFILIDPLRKAMSGTLRLHELLRQYIDDAKSRGIELDKTQVDYIEGTHRALLHSGIDKKGYYRYLEDGQETDLSKNLKAIYNVIWAVNQLSKGYWENPGTAAHLNMMKHAKRAYDEFLKIDWAGFNVHGSVISDQIMNAMLLYGKDMVFSKLQQVAESTHDVELQQNLRFGVLLEHMRPLFDGFESVYQERGLGALENPLGYSKKTEAVLQTRLSSLQENEQAAIQDFKTFDALLKNLEAYEQVAKQISQPLPTGSRYGGTLPIIELHEQKAQTILMNLTMLKQKYELSDDEKNAFDKVEDRLISDLTLEAKRSFLEKLRQIKSKDTDYNVLLLKVPKQIIQNKKQIEEHKTKSFYERGRDTVAAIVSGSTQLPWPTDEFNLVSDFAYQLRSDSENQLVEIEKYAEAVTSHKKMQKEFALRTLQADGLVSLMESAEQNSQSGVKKQRKLAIILADIRGESRSSYLKDVTLAVNGFTTVPDEISKFINAVHASDSALGHALAVEAVLAGYVSDVTPDILYSHDLLAVQNDVENVLDKLDIKYVLNTLKENQPNTLSDQTALLISLLKNQAVTKESLDAVRRDYSGDTRFNQELLINLLVNKYHQYQEAVTDDVQLSEPHVMMMHKIGLFLGRLGHADTHMADIIFKNSDARTILKNEAVERKKTDQLKPNSALYFESLVNSFRFSYYRERHETENRNFNLFLEMNKKPILEVYKALHPHTELSDNEIIQFYKEEDGQVELLNQMGRFTKTYLSAGSHAEQSMREFISALLLCNNTYRMRNVLLSSQNKSFGAKNAGYLEFLTTEASLPFWNLIKQDLHMKSIEIESEFKKFKTEMTTLISKSALPADNQEQFNTEINSFLSQNMERLNEACRNILNEQDTVLNCRCAAQEMSAIRVDLANKKIILNSQLTSRRDFTQLQAELAKIESILDEYLDNKLMNLVHAVTGNNLLREKQKLAKEFKSKFHELKEQATSLDANYNELARKAVDLGEQLEANHMALLQTVTGKDSEDKLTGRLGKKIELAKTVLSTHTIPEGDMQQMLARVAAVVTTIRSRLHRISLFHRNKVSNTQAEGRTEKEEKHHRPS